MTNILIAIGAFGAAFLGCVQAINVVNGYKIRAAIFSTLIAISQLTLYKTVPNTTEVSSMLIFVLFGVVGAQASMYVKNGVVKKIP